jgi:arabinofuranosyltransferase
MRMRASLILLLLLAGLQFLYDKNEFWDDAFIGMIYARNVARGVGPAFLPAGAESAGQFSRVEGYSNPLWVFLIAGFYWLPGSVFFWIKLASLLAAGLLALSCAGLFARLVEARASTLPQWLAALPALLIILTPTFFVYIKSGMETVAFAALVMTAAWHSVSVRGEDRRLPYVLNALLWLLVSLTRPEGVLYASAAGLYLVLAGNRSRLELSRFLLWGSLLGVSLGAFYSWRYLYYGEWLPNTFYAKVGARGMWHPTGALNILESGFFYVIDYFQSEIPLVTGLFALAGLFWLRRLNRPVLLLLLLLVAANLAFVIAVGGDFWPLARFLHPSTAVITILSVVPAAMLVARFPRVGMLTPVALVLLQPSVPVLLAIEFYEDRPFFSHQQAVEFLGARHLTPQFLMGKWLNENLPPDAVLAVDQAGQIPYYCDREVVDLLGLNDHHLARHPLTLDYLKRRGVTHLLPAVIEREGKPDVLYPYLFKDPKFQRQFQLAQIFEGHDQHGRRHVFGLLLRADLLPGREGAGACPSARKTLADMLTEDIPVTSLTPLLVRDLTP